MKVGPHMLLGVLLVVSLVLTVIFLRRTPTKAAAHKPPPGSEPVPGPGQIVIRQADGSVIRFENEAGAPSPPVLLEDVPVIEGRLSVRVYAHHLTSIEGTIPVWTYVSDGLWALGQREIVFTVKREVDEGTGEFPRELLQLYSIVHSLAAQGRFVDIGGRTALARDRPFLGRADLHTVFYTWPQGLDGIPVAAPFLTAIVFPDEETEAANACGDVRLLAALGRRYRFFPTPPWTDRRRPPLITLSSMEGSVLRRFSLPSLVAPGAVAFAEMTVDSSTEQPGPGPTADHVLRARPARIVLRIPRRVWLFFVADGSRGARAHARTHAREARRGWA